MGARRERLGRGEVGGIDGGGRGGVGGGDERGGWGRGGGVW